MVNPLDPIHYCACMAEREGDAPPDTPGSNTPRSTSDLGITPPILGHIGENRRSGQNGVRGRNWTKSDRTQRPRAVDMSAGNAPPFPVSLVPGKERERGWKLSGSGIWRYLQYEVIPKRIRTFMHADERAHIRF